MLCKTCSRMLQDRVGFQRHGGSGIEFDHHKQIKALQSSRKQGCSICSALADQMERNGIELKEDCQLPLRAILSILWRHHEHGYYCLQFTIEKDVVRKFVLKKAENKAIGRRTGTSPSTGSLEVFKLANRWLSRCKCANSKQDWYPDRLLDLHHIKRAIFSEEDPLATRVKLVQTSEEWKIARASEDESTRYVTLSHCWGKHPMPVKLTIRNLKTFLTEGITVADLPKSFREAVIFASRLEGVRYLWIDSLCIIQKCEEDIGRAYEEDWLTQSAIMGKIYHQSYLNLSATIASDSSRGMFFLRDPESLHEDIINLNVTNIPRGAGDKGNLWMRMKTWIVYLFKFGRGAKPNNRWMKCEVIDISAWDDLVERAPVNTRAWVYQERLLAPRVLHFCRNQIAWECSEFDCSESYPEGIPGIKLSSFGDVVREDRLKGLSPEKEGKMLRMARLEVSKDPDEHLPRLFIYELWKRIVEVYSQKSLSYPGDKLIALSGIATHFFGEIIAPGFDHAQYRPTYVAGMWKEYLESQLLWQVDIAFEKGRFCSNKAKRYADRAPSFSWASLDVSRGITYGDFTDKDLLFQVKDVELRYKDPQNKFGLVEAADCRLLLNAYLGEIELRELDQDTFGVLWGWRLINTNIPVDSTQWDPVDDFNGNNYMDSPDSDTDAFEPDSRIFCMLGGRGLRTDENSDRYLYCLLLQLKGQHADHRVFKRVGIAKVRGPAEEQTKKACMDAGIEEIYLA